MRNQVIAACALAAIGCGPDSRMTGEWAGTVRDSAGAVVIDNPESALWTSETQWRLREDLRIGVRAAGASTYDVFDAEGRHLGVIATPNEFEPLRSDSMFTALGVTTWACSMS